MRLAIALAAAGAAIMASAQRPQEPTSAMEWFHRMDRNGDGKLSREEARSPRSREFDADGDGLVTLTEWIGHFNRDARKQLDRDGDGRISQQEFNRQYQSSARYFDTRRCPAQPEGVTEAATEPPRVQRTSAISHGRSATDRRGCRRTAASGTTGRGTTVRRFR